MREAHVEEVVVAVTSVDVLVLLNDEAVPRHGIDVLQALPRQASAWESAGTWSPLFRTLAATTMLVLMFW